MANRLETRDATPRPQTFDAATRSIDAVIASAAPVQRQDARGPFLEILDPAGLDVAACRGASVLDSHQQHGLDNVLGTLDSVRIEGNEVIGTIRFSERPEIAPIISDVRSGVIQHLSVGYEVASWKDGTDAAGNRTRTATRWTIREASFVAVPADRNAHTRAAAACDNRAGLNEQIRALGAQAHVSDRVINGLIDRQVSVDQARNEILWEMAMRSATTSVSSAHNQTTMDNPEARVRAMGDALYTRVVPSFTPIGAARQFVGLTIPDLAGECLDRAGVAMPTRTPSALITRALNTTSDFPLVLQDVVNKSLRDGYAAAPSTIRQLCRETTAQDFRRRHRIQLDSTSFKLEAVNEAGEFKTGQFLEAEETYKIGTYGKIFGITRQVLVNDDLGAFSDVSRRLGLQASAFEAQFLTTLLVGAAGIGPTMADGKAFFHTDHGNLAGSGAALSDTTLAAARLALRKQVSLAGELIDVQPWAVLVPSDLETLAEKTLTTIRAIQTSDVNVFSFLKLIIEPRLTDTYRWYVAANPAIEAAFEYAYLASAPGPQTETRAGFEVDGLQVKVRLDFGGGAIEPRAMYANPGH